METQPGDHPSDPHSPPDQHRLSNRQSPDLARQPGIMVFAGLGMLNAICLAIGLGVGWLVDGVLGTLPLFLFVGMAAGIALGVVATRNEWKRYS